MKHSYSYRSLALVVFVLTMIVVKSDAQCPDRTWDSSNIGSAYVNELGSKAIYGSFYNMEDGQHVNDGRLYFFGNITNNGFIGDGYGYEYIKSCDHSDTTIIAGRGATEFNIVDVDNPNGVSVRKDLRVKTNLTFSAGLISTDRSQFGHRVFFQEGATYRSSSNTKHINGRISRQGIGPFSFPTGDGNHISAIGIEPNNGNDIYTAAYYSEQLSPEEFSAEGIYDRNAKEFNVLTVQTKEHWTLRGAQTTSVTLNFTPYSEINSLTTHHEDLIVVGWDGRKWVDLGNTRYLSAFGSGSVTSASITPNRYRAFTFGVRDTDGDLYSDALDIDPRDPCVPEPTTPACEERACVDVDLRVYLEGAMMNGGIGNYSDHMRTEINQFGYLPGQAPFTLLGTQTPMGQPYNQAPWNHQGGEGNMFDYFRTSNTERYDEDAVDWVLVSLRSTESKNSTVCAKAGILYADGTIGMTAPFDCCNSNETEYYVVVEHRNHLPVMTSTPMPVVGGMITYDFTSSQSYTRLLGRGQKEIHPGVFAMYAGNGDQVTANESSKDINSNDVSLWAEENGQHSGYYQQDYDLNGDVNVHDKALWLMNNGVFTDVDR